MPHPCFREPLPSIKAAFIALDGSTAFLTYFSAEIMLLSGLFVRHKTHTERKKKTNARKNLFFYFYIYFLATCFQNSHFGHLGWGLFAVTGLCSSECTQGHPALWLAGPQDQQISAIKEEKMAQLEHSEGHNSLK